MRREELRRLDPQRAIALLCGEADYTVAPRAPRPTSGLIEQQRWFMQAAHPPAIAPTTSSGSAPVDTASGSGASGGSCDRSRPQAKNRR